MKGAISKFLLQNSPTRRRIWITENLIKFWKWSGTYCGYQSCHHKWPYSNCLALRSMFTSMHLLFADYDTVLNAERGVAKVCALWCAYQFKTGPTFLR